MRRGINSFSNNMIVLLLREAFMISLIHFGVVLSEPQTKLIKQDCTKQTAIVDVLAFPTNFNNTFDDIRKQLSNNRNIHFATAIKTDVYGMVQCRNYLSTADCIACLDFGRTEVRRFCPTYNGGHVIYQGCSLRYEAYNFYTNTQLVSFEAASGVCSPNKRNSEATAFTAVVQGLIKDLVVATPKINGFFAATTRPLSTDSNATGGTVYAVSQCMETISQKDCKRCLTIGYNNIQSCPPASEGSTYDAGCFLRYSDASFFPDKSVINIKPYLRGGGTSRSKTSIIVGIMACSFVISLILALLLWYRLVRKPNMAQRAEKFGLSKLEGPVIYNFKYLKSATRSFSEDTKIGEGGFGDVYKGITKNGNVLAVKKLSVGTKKAKADFGTEVRLISSVNHRNIIRLLGCSARGSVLLLVFEYMSKGSLDTFLYGAKRGSLSWKQRADIILGIARGLVYLHEQFHLCVIHRDIKSSNILLDDDFQPKIADFGLARLIGDDQSHLSTKFAGTVGYTAPEYAIHGHLSEKVDTYSFGVVVLEIVSGRRCTNLTIEPVNGSLLVHAWNLYEKDMHLDLVDESLDPNEYIIDDVKTIIETALMCTQSPTSVRPTMSEVIVLLTSDRSIDQRPPDKPIFF